MQNLTTEELVQLIATVFPKMSDDNALAILVDFPKNAEEDNNAWEERRTVAWEWWQSLHNCPEKMDLQKVSFIAYDNVGANNADLPEQCYVLEENLPKFSAELATVGKPIALTEVFETHQLYLAPTEYSTTAPLKMAAPRYQFRAATMPGFALAMIPALRIDYSIVSSRVNTICEKITRAVRADVVMIVDKEKTCEVTFDLRNRHGHSSSGCFPTRGLAGNVPSGEAYIVPYEGEGEPSQTHGILPVQFGDEIVYYTLENNIAILATGDGPTAEKENELIHYEKAYANIAELGFGVLGDFGLDPIGEILLDEKLGFHIAFGRSDHFGGMVSPACFTSPKAVVHIDRIFIPQMQPRIHLKSVILAYPDGTTETIIDNAQFLASSFAM